MLKHLNVLSLHSLFLSGFDFGGFTVQRFQGLDLVVFSGAGTKNGWREFWTCCCNLS
jgi:hypothetical protein